MGYRIYLDENVTNYAHSLSDYYRTGRDDLELDLDCQRTFQSSEIGAIERHLYSPFNCNLEFEIFSVKLAEDTYRHYETHKEALEGANLIIFFDY